MVLLHESLRERQAEPGSTFTAGYQWIENLVADFRWNARPVV
jgi:hypothetical protein